MPGRIDRRINRKRGRSAVLKTAADKAYDMGRDRRSANLMKRSTKNMTRADELQSAKSLANRGNPYQHQAYDKELNQPFGQDKRGVFYKKNPNDAWHTPFKKGGSVTKAKMLRNPKGSRRSL